MSVQGYTESIATLAVRNILAVLSFFFLMNDQTMPAIALAVGAFYVNQQRILWLLEMEKLERDFDNSIGASK